MTTKYWVGGGATTNWDATGNTNWALTSGGANNAAVPTTGDAVVFDSNSGSGASVMDVSLSLIAMDCNGFVGTLTHNTGITLTITGNDAGAPASNTLRFGSGMTYGIAGAARQITMTSTSGTSTITTNGITLGNLTCNGAGGTFQLGSALTLFANVGTLTLTAGTFNANNFNLSVGFLSTNNSNTRVLTMGSGTWTVTASGGTALDLGTITGLTVNGNTSTLLFSQGLNGARTLVFNSTTGWNTISIADTGHSVSSTSYNGAFSCNSMVLAAGQNLTSAASQLITVANAMTVTGTSSLPVFINGWNLSIPAGSTLAWCGIRGTTFSGAATASNSLNFGGNTGVTITPPSVGGGGAMVGC